jgi:hypothetical protein
MNERLESILKTVFVFLYPEPSTSISTCLWFNNLSYQFQFLSACVLIYSATDFHFYAFVFQYHQIPFQRICVLVSSATNFHFNVFVFQYLQLLTSISTCCVLIYSATDFHFYVFVFQYHQLPFQRVCVSVSSATDFHFDMFMFSYTQLPTPVFKCLCFNVLSY